MYKPKNLNNSTVVEEPVEEVKIDESDIEDFLKESEVEADNWIDLNVQELIDRNETFKIKWLQLSDDDLFQWLNLQDEMITKASNLKSTYLEQKLAMDRDKALRTLELKQEKDENWKWYTEKWIEALIKKEFFEKDFDLTVIKTTCDLLVQKAWIITEYVNIVKMNKKAAFSI